jgi:hypothetical protein
MYQQLSEISSDIQMSKFGHLPSAHYIHVSKDVSIRGYFSKPKGGPRAESLGNAAVSLHVDQIHGPGLHSPGLCAAL